MKDMTTIEIVGFKEYQKKTIIKAVQMKKPFKVKCMSGWSIGESGDWLAEQDDGMRFILKDDFFKLNYEIVKEPNEYEIKPVIMKCKHIGKFPPKDFVCLDCEDTAEDCNCNECNGVFCSYCNPPNNIITYVSCDEVREAWQREMKKK